MSNDQLNFCIISYRMHSGHSKYCQGNLLFWLINFDNEKVARKNVEFSGWNKSSNIGFKSNRPFD
jgi:hypothetical protein